jgi:hypothetical protein
MSSHNAVIRRIQRFSVKDFASMLASAPQRAAEARAEKALAELEKTRDSAKAAIADNLEKAQELFAKVLPLIVRNILKKSGELTTQILENDATMTTIAQTAYTFMPSVFRLLVKEDVFVKLVLQSRAAIVEYVEGLERAQKESAENTTTA